MKKLLPNFKPSDFESDNELFYKEKLFDNNESPIIAYGTDTGMTVMYISASSKEEYYKEFKKIKKEALLNLKTIETNYQITEIEDSKILFAEGEYASEKILDKDFMLKISSELGTTSLMVGIPLKGVLIAIDSNSSIRMKLPVMVKQYYQNPEYKGLCEKVFLINNGEISGMGGDGFSEEDNNQGFVISEDKNQNYSIDIKSENLEELHEELNSVFPQVMMMIMERKKFGGNITFKLKNIPLNTELVQQCNKYIEQIEKNEMLQVISEVLVSNKVNFKFLHNNKQIAPSENLNEIPQKKWWEFWK